MAIKNQELLIRPGDDCVFRTHVPMKAEYRVTADRAYPGKIMYHGSMGTGVLIVNDVGQRATHGVSYSHFDSGMASLELQVDEKVLEERREAVIAKLLKEAEAKHFEELEGIRAMFLDL